MVVCWFLSSMKSGIGWCEYPNIPMPSIILKNMPVALHCFLLLFTGIFTKLSPLHFRLLPGYATNDLMNYYYNNLLRKEF